MTARRLLAASLAAGIVVLLPISAEARAGGGHSTGGGSHSSGGTHSSGGAPSSGGSSHSSGGSSGGSYHGGSGGSSSGGLIPVGMFSPDQIPPMVPIGIGGLLLLLVAIWLYRRHRRRVVAAAGSYDDVDADDAAQAAAAASAAAYGLTAIRAGDPHFDEAAFLERASRTFLVAQQAWSDRNLVAVRPLMGQGTYLSWESQIRQMARRHQKDVMENVAIKEGLIVRAVNGPYDHITVRFKANAVDYTVDDRTGAVLTGDKKPADFVEYWTFERSGGAATLQKEGVLEQKCPNCGGPLNVNAIGECMYCRAAITNGTYDWVLQRIDQAGYWQNS